MVFISSEPSQWACFFLSLWHNSNHGGRWGMNFLIYICIYIYIYIWKAIKWGFWLISKASGQSNWLERHSLPSAGQKQQNKENFFFFLLCFLWLFPARAPWSWLGFFVCLFCCCFGRTTQHAGSYFPNQGPNPRSLPWKCRVNHWTAGEVPWLCFT